MRAPDFWQHGNPFAGLLTPLSWIWRVSMAARTSRVTPVKLDVPVICIGNAVVGGAGKTPVAISVACLARQLGLNPHFLSRGYGGANQGPLCVDPSQHLYSDVGDEPLLLARHAPTWVARKRVSGGKHAISNGADVIVMDDGFQNPEIHKDFSILVVDGGYGFGNGRVIPAGPLRESMQSALERSDAVAIIGADTEKVQEAVSIGKPVLKARFVPKSDHKDISGKRVIAFAGIGRPAKFFETLTKMGCDVIETRSFPDHCVFAKHQVLELLELAETTDAILVTTEKDEARLPPEMKSEIHILRVKLEWNDREAFDKVTTRAILKKA
ncbi:MAG: tetraacyldisaccharide 4'-kinase [Pseudomonadota bacterium]|nr:tetraacyldisaccharide 4'-kinase [Pseudomonadota bacterium]